MLHPAVTSCHTMKMIYIINKKYNKSIITIFYLLKDIIAVKILKIYTPQKVAVITLKEPRALSDLFGLPILLENQNVATG